MEHLEVRRKTGLAEARAIDGMALLGLKWWESARSGEGALPRCVDSLPQPLALLVASTYLVHVARLTPARFLFSLGQHAGATCPDTTALMAFGPKLRDVRRPLSDDLGFVAFSGTPSYQLVELRQSGAPPQRYRRLILPLSSDESAVDQLLCLAKPDDGADQIGAVSFSSFEKR